VIETSCTATTFQCRLPHCAAVFSRHSDLQRHINNIHSKTTIFWCPAQDCKRNLIGLDNKPFPRKDKRNEHFFKVHKELSFDTNWLQAFDFSLRVDPVQDVANTSVCGQGLLAFADAKGFEAVDDSREVTATTFGYIQGGDNHEPLYFRDYATMVMPTQPIAGYMPISQEEVAPVYANSNDENYGTPSVHDALLSLDKDEWSSIFPEDLDLGFSFDTGFGGSPWL
jgi:uncharacterized C2H2 Zn-finger protein